MENLQSLIINKTNFANCSTKNEPITLLKDGEVRLKIDRFALTSNNITYAVVGDQMGYWQFFPTSNTEKTDDNDQNTYGIIPVWGFATVVESKHADIKIGQSYYGFYPMANYLTVKPARNSEHGFMDGAEHRSSLASVYNFYTATLQDKVYTKATENLQCLLRPLFTTSFLLDAYFKANNYFDSQQIILTSASSKTALALAYLLKLSKQTIKNDLQIIALTSAKNKTFVENSAYYDAVLSYKEYSAINTKVNSSIVDFSGNHQLQYDVQTHLKDALKHNCLVGLVDWKAVKGDQKLPQKGSFFFAPTHAKEKQQEWGIAGFNQKLMEVWVTFIEDAKNWMEVKELQGLDSLKEVYLQLLQGDFDARNGYIFKM